MISKFFGSLSTAPGYNKHLHSPMEKTDHGRNRHHVYALETTGLLIVAATLLTITLVRYWYAIHWNLR